MPEMMACGPPLENPYFYNDPMETTHIHFCLTDLLRAASPALDAGVRPQSFASPHHSRQVAYIALRVGRLVFLSEREAVDLVALALLRDIGVSPDCLYNTTSHCRAGEKSLSTLLNPAIPMEALRYHHENYNGTGLFGLHGQDIPLAAQILRLADVLTTRFDLAAAYRDARLRERIEADVRKRSGTIYSPETADAFLNLAEQSSFWYELTNPVVDHALAQRCPRLTADLPLRDIRQITRLLAGAVRARKSHTTNVSLRSRRSNGHIVRWALSHRLAKDVIRKMLIAEDLRALGLVVPGYAFETVEGFYSPLRPTSASALVSRIS